MEKTSGTISYSVEVVATIEPVTDDLIPVPNKDRLVGPSKIEDGLTKKAVVIRKCIFHANQARGRESLARGVHKALRNGQPIHAFFDGKELGPLTKAKTTFLAFPLKALREVIDDARIKGISINLYRPKEGIPVYFDKNWEEKLTALQRKTKRWYHLSKIIKS